MNLDNNSWLTFAAMVRKCNLDEMEARRLVKHFEKFLAPRNFGDIVKYPAPAAELLVRLTSLRRQGWSNEDLKNLLIMTRQEIRDNNTASRFNLLAELRQESAALLQNLEIIINFGSHMQEALRSMANLMTSFDSLIGTMLDEEEKRSELRAEGSPKNLPCESTEQ